MGKNTDATQNVVIPLSGATAETKTDEVRHNLGVAGFLSEDAAKREYVGLSRVRFQVYALDSLLMRLEAVKVKPETLRDIILNDAVGMRDGYGVDSFTVVTPGLELLSEEDFAELGLKSVNLSSAIAVECARQKLKHVGLLGTAWDMAEEGPLVKALKKRHIKSYVPPEIGIRQMLLTCAQLGMLGSLYYEQQVYKANKFCLKAVDLICESAPDLNALVICNPEFRWLAKDITSRWPKLKIVDATQVHWDVMRKFVAGA